MGIAQFTEITLLNKSQKAFKIANVNIKWGKIYPEGNKNGPEISSASVDGTQIAPNDHYVFRSCGRSDSPSGTEGSFDIFDGNNHVKSIYWDSPWGSSANVFSVTGGDRKWIAGIDPAGNQGSGAGPLGNVTVTFVYIG